MYHDLRDRAITNLEKRKKKEKTAQIIGVILGSVALFLFGIRAFLDPADRNYMFIPIGILALVYCIIYTILLGVPFVENDDISEEDIEMEVAKIYRKYKRRDRLELTEEERLELQEIEILIDDREEYV